VRVEDIGEMVIGNIEMLKWKQIFLFWLRIQ
jgi:hypothetical protein